MTSPDELREEVDSLRRQVTDLQQRAAVAEQALTAFARGEVDALVFEGAATPILLNAAQEDLRRNQKLLRAIFDGALDAMILVNDTNICIDVNPSACELMGFSRDEIVGTSIARSAEPGYAGEESFREGRLRGQFPIRRPDGSTRVTEFSATANVTPGRHLVILRDMTDRIETETALRRSEALFRAVVEKSSEAVSLTGPDGTTRYLTPAAADVLGWTPEELSTPSPRDQVFPEDRSRLELQLDQLVREGRRDMELEVRVRRADGSVRWIHAMGTNLLDDPDVRAVVGNYRDITERQNAEHALRESRDRLEEAQAMAHVGSWTSGLGLDEVIHATPECLRIFGVPEDTVLTVGSLRSLVHPADIELLERAERDAIERGIPMDFEHRMVRPDGRPCWVHVRAWVKRDLATPAGLMVGILQDITERRLAVEALRASEERYRRIVEGTSEGVIMYDASAAITFTNRRMAEMLGWSVDELVGQSLLSLVSPARLDEGAKYIDEGRRQSGARGDLLLRRKDGTDLLVSMDSTPLLDAEGGFEVVLAMMSDVGAQRASEEARARLAAIVESSDDAVVSASLDGVITSWNLGAEKLYQYSVAEMPGNSIFRLVPPADWEEERLLFARVGRGEAVRQYETKRCRKDGTLVEVAVTASPIRDAAGAVVGVSKIARDLTARRQTEVALRQSEEQLRQAQKMDAVGRLAGGVAHDFNNLLSVILSYVALAVEVLKPGDPLRDDIEEIGKAAKRAATLTRQLLAFSRQQVLQPQVVDLNQVLSGMKSMLARLLGEDIELTFFTTPNLGRVLADPGQVEQVVMNLAVNARDAMPAGGKLTIELTNLELEGEYVATHLNVAAGKYVMLSVSDNGIGMDAATRSRVFEPFFSTKGPGKGTGLGLSTVFGIVEQSGGHVGVYSEPGRGCTFKVYFPRTQQAVRNTTPAPSPAVRQGHETVLLVEDEEQVRTVACAILRRNGYQVLETSNAGEAFLVAQELPGKIHLLLTDVVLPRMSGRKLAERLAELRPEMKILFASGYTDDAIIHHGVLDSGMAFLQKPFTPESLLRKVREVLGPALSIRPGEEALPSSIASGAPPPQTKAGEHKRRATVLVIDDEPVLVKLFVHSLRHLYDVTGVEDSREALSRIVAGERFDAIVCDLAMPHLSGMALYDEVLRVAPELAPRIGFLSGGDILANTQAFFARVRNRRLLKPITPSTLVAFVAELLQRSEESSAAAS